MAFINNPARRNIILILLFVYLIYLLVFTLMPFTFSLEPSTSFTHLMIERFENLSAFWSTHPWEMFSNISFLIPFGFLLASLPGLSPCRLYTQILFAGVITFILCYAIELCQLFLETRSPSMTDVFLNTVGGMTGALMAFFYHAPLTRLAFQFWVRVHRSRWLPKILTLYVLVFVAMSMPIYRADFSNWDPTFHLLLGNEASLSRPWLGKMYMVAIYDRALSPTDIATNYTAGPFYNITKGRIQDGLVAFYDFAEGSGTTIQDRSSFGLPLDLQIPDPDNIKWLSPNGIEFLGNTIITSPRPADKLYDSNINRRSTLTVEAWVSSKDIQQSGPARIVSYSKDVSKRNFTLGQEKRNIIFRLRTPLSGLNGSTPQLQTSDNPLTTGLYHLMVTYRKGRETLFVNGKEYKSTRLVGRKHLKLFYSIGKWAYWFVFLFPLGFLSYICFKRSYTHSRTAFFISAFASLAVLAGNEGISVFIFHHGADFPLLTVGVGIILISILTSALLSKNVLSA